MLSPKLVLLLLLLVSLSACSGSAERQAALSCQQDIRAWLPSPDSAEFLAFEPISQQQWQEQIFDIMTYHMADDPPYIRNAFTVPILNRVQYTAQNVVAQGGGFYRYEVSFRDASGTSRTSWQFCAVTSDACACASRDEVASGHRPVLPMPMP